MPFRSESEISLIDRPISEKVVGSGQVSAAWLLAIALFAALVIGPTLHSAFIDTSTAGGVVTATKNPGFSVAENPLGEKSLTICADQECLVLSTQQIQDE